MVIALLVAFILFATLGAVWASRRGINPTVFGIVGALLFWALFGLAVLEGWVR